MSDNPSSTAESEDQRPAPAVSNAVSTQPTGLVETTFAETLGLSMHNAVASQQSSQMTTSASITNACARLLQASRMPEPKEKPKDKKPTPAAQAADTQGITADKRDAPTPKRKFNIMNFIKPKPKKDEASTATQDAQAPSAEQGQSTDSEQDKL